MNLNVEEANCYSFYESCLQMALMAKLNNPFIIGYKDAWVEKVVYTYYNSFFNLYDIQHYY